MTNLEIIKNPNAILDTPAFDTNKPWLVTRRSKRSLIPFLLWGVITAYGAYLWSSLTPAIRVPEIVPYLGGLRLGTLWIIPLGVLLEAVRRFYNDLYIFDATKIIHQEGRLSLKYSIPVIKYVHIRAIKVRQSILGRILNYGDVMLGTASEEGNEMIVGAVRDPASLARAVDSMRCDLEKMTKRRELEVRTTFRDVAS